MDFRSKFSKYFVFQFFLIAWIVFGNCQLWGMEVAILSVGEEAEVLLREAGIEDANALFAEARGAIEENLGKLTPQQMETLGNDVRSILKEKIGNIIDDLKAAGYFKGDIPFEERANTLKETILKNKTSFFSDLKAKATQGFTFEEGGILDRIGDVPEELQARYGEIDVLHGNAENFRVRPDDQVPGSNNNRGKFADKVNAIEKNFQNFLKEPGVEDVDTFNNRVEGYKKFSAAAKAEYEAAATDELDAAQKKAANARLKKSTAQTSEAKANAKAEVKAADKELREVELKQAYDRYEQAKGTRDSANQELKKAKDVYKGNQAKIDEYQKSFDEANDKYVEASKNWKETHSYFEGQGWSKDFIGTKLKTTIEPKLPELPTDAWAAAKGAGKGLWKGTKWIGEKGWGLTKSTGELLLQAGAFMLPQLALDQINAWAQKQAMLDTLRTTQLFGNIRMKLPDDLIDEANPVQSKFVYVGVPSKDQKLTKVFLDTANYYGSKSEYGDIAAYGITDPNFPHVMLHLDTGLVFVGDGVPFNEDAPTIPLLDDTQREKDLKTVLDDLAGEVGSGSVGETYEMFSMHASGYAGDKNIANLFKSPGTGDKTSYPLLLQRTLTALQNGTNFGDCLVQGFRGLNTQNKNDIAMWNLLIQGSSAEKALHAAALDEPYVGWGLYIYQTKDTPFIKNIRSTISRDDIAQDVAAQDLVDYVVMLDNEQQIVPLQTPQAQAPYNYASYTLNSDIVYMVSLLDPTKALYTKNKKDWGKDIYNRDNPLEDARAKFDRTDLPAELKNKADALFGQIDQMKYFIAQQAKFGPFSVGAITMTTTKDLIDKEIFIYKVPGYLGTGIDDYVIALKRNLETKRSDIVQLPTAADNFVSLVTSRFYNSAFKPALVSVPYFVMQQPDRTDLQVTTNKALFPAGSKTVCSGTAPLYTLFVESDLNPTKCEGKGLPNIDGWALNQFSFPSKEEKPPMLQKFLSDNEPDLLTAINAARASWRAAAEKVDPSIVTAQMGPFNFTPQGALQNVQLTAVNEAAIINQNFVYHLDTVPDEYFVLATDAQGANAGEPYNVGNPQQFAVSLSTGHVYSAQAQEGKVPGERVDQPALDLQAILARAQSATKFSPDLLAAVQRSEEAYNERIARNLYGSNVDFAQFNFYITKEDYLKGQYIYADVTKLGNPLDEKGNPIPSIVSQVTNYFVCIERTASTEGCSEGCPPVMDGDQPVLKDGKPLYWHYDFGTNLASGNTYAVASLISGASYGQDNNYLGTYDQFRISGPKGESSITDIKGFTTRTLQGIEARTKQKIRPELMAAIQRLTANLEKNLKAEEDELADAEAEYTRKYPPLGNNLKVQLDRLPYIDNPNLLPRYLKYHEASKKYFAVTPGYVSSPKPTDSTGKEIDVPADGSGPDRMYVDYNFDPKGSGAKQDFFTGMIYDSNGNAQVLLTPDKKWVTDPATQKRKKVINGPGWALLAARAFAGIEVASNGIQTRTIGITAPSAPMGDAPGSTNYLKPTGFDTIVDSIHKTTFDFLYHTKLDTFFFKVTTPNKYYYINLTSGYAYNPDGTPRWFESPVYTTKNSGDMLFIGNDAFDILKVALYKASTKEFTFYTMVGSFAAMKTDAPYKARGTYCVMVNDNDPDSKIQLFQATKNAETGGATDGTGVPFPYYLVWDIPYVAPKSDTKAEETTAKAPTPVLLGQFAKDSSQAYSLLLYAQTRNKGEPIEKGVFDADDNYIDPTADVKKPKTVGIVFDTNHKITAVIYQDQLLPLKGNTITVKNSDGTTRTVTVSQTKKNMLPASNPQGITLTAEWISFEDGSKIYDYEYDLYVLNTQPEFVPAGQVKTDALNLYYLKHGDPSLIGTTKGGFGLNVTPYVPFNKPKKDTKDQTPKEPVSGVALASILNPSGNVDANDVIYPAGLSDDFKRQAQNNLGYISVDDSGALFINNVVSGPTKRFVYQLVHDQDKNQNYSAPGLYEWYIDLANGILYDSTGFPSGAALNAPQLYTLLDTLQFSVVYDKDGNQKLMYRLITEEPAAQQTVAPRPLSAKESAAMTTLSRGAPRTPKPLSQSKRLVRVRSKRNFRRK